MSRTRNKHASATKTEAAVVVENDLTLWGH